MCYEIFSSVWVSRYLNVSFWFCHKVPNSETSETLVKVWVECEAVSKISGTLSVHVMIVIWLLWRVMSRRWTAAAWRRLVSAFSPRPASCVLLFPLESQPQTCCPETEPVPGNTQNDRVSSCPCKSSWNILYSRHLPPPFFTTSTPQPSFTLVVYGEFLGLDDVVFGFWLVTSNQPTKSY